MRLLIIITCFTHFAVSATADTLSSFCNRRNDLAVIDLHRTAKQYNIVLPITPLENLDLREDELVQLEYSLRQKHNPGWASIFNSIMPKVGPYDKLLKSSYPYIYYESYRVAIGLNLSQAPREILFDRLVKKDWMDSDNSILDARRHILWSALLTQKFGQKITTCLLLVHEGELNVSKRSPYKIKEQKNSHYMDLINNNIGIYLGINGPKSFTELNAVALDFINNGSAYVLNPWSSDIVPSTHRLNLFKRYWQYR